MFDKRSQAVAVLRAAELQTGVTPVVEVSHPPPVAGTSALIAVESLALPLDATVAKLFPRQQVAPGSVISTVGSRLLQYRILSAASQAGTWVTFVGSPTSCAVAMSQNGIDLERVAFVPDPGINAASACAALLEAMCVVVGSDIKLSAAEHRRLAARARERGNVILSESPWPGAHLSFRVLSKVWGGAERGEGWLQSCTMTVERTGRGIAAKPKKFEVVLE